MLVRDAMRRGVPPPEFILNAPTINSSQMFYVEAFYALCTCRSYMGLSGVPSAIPWTAVSQYADRLCLSGEEAFRFIKIMERLDDWFMRKGENGPSTIQQKNNSDK